MIGKLYPGLYAMLFSEGRREKLTGWLYEPVKRRCVREGKGEVRVCWKDSAKVR